MAWQKGPLPENTWHWGGVMVVGEGTSGFHFADFKGDCAELVYGQEKRLVKAEEVAFFDNSLRITKAYR